MNAGAVQRLVGVNIAHAAQETLVEQQRLDHGAPRTEAGDEGRRIERERIRSELFQARGELIAELDAAELPDIVIDQRSAVQRDNGVAVRAEFGIEQQLAGHSKMNSQDGARVGEIND